jgi:hypothetical protein
MARRRKSDASQSVSLFPFLSILACVIGTLTLMITALALGQMDSDAVASAEQFERQKQRHEADLARLELIREKLSTAEASADDAQRELAAARQRLAQLQDQVQQAIQKKDDPVEVEIPQVDPEGHEQRMARLREELQQVQQQQKQLRQQLAALNKPPEEAQVRIQPSGSGVDLKPTFVECTAPAIVLYQGDKPRRVLRADLGTDESWLQLLDKIAANPKETVVFLIRENGLSTYNTAQNVARSRYARNGKLPVVGKGKIDLSLFQGD